MKPAPRIVGLGVALVCFAAALNAEAQLSYRLAPVGGRSQLLGGTGVVFGRDASASFLNPATAVLVDDQRLSFSVNFYQLTFTSASNWYTPGAVDRSKFPNVGPSTSSLTNVDFDTLPSSLCFYFTTSKLQFVESAKGDPRTRDAHVGICFATVASEEFNFGAQDFSQIRNGSTTRQVQTISQKYSQFSAGPTYAFRVNNALSLGASVHASLTNHKSLLSASGTTYDASGAPPITSSFYGASKGTAFQMEATVGATLRFGKQTVGLSIRSPTAQIVGFGGVNRDTTYAGAGSENYQLNASGSFVASSPLRIALGTGVEGEWGQFEVNAAYFHQLGDSYRAELDGHQVVTTASGVVDQPVSLDLHQRSHGVVNFAAGAEVFMSPRISFLSGFSTDVTAAPGGTLQGSLFNYFGDSADRVTASLGIGTHGTAGELMVGTELSYQWGQRLAVNSYQLPPVIGTADYHTFGFMFVIAGSTSLRAIKRAVDDVKKVVTDPTPQKPLMKPEPQAPVTNPTPQKPIELPLP